MQIDNWCAFFQRIEADPKAKIKGLTIGDLYAAQDHVAHCAECYAICDRVLARYPEEDAGGIPMGLN